MSLNTTERDQRIREQQIREPWIREQVLRGISANRTPGYHFPNHFLEIWFGEVSNTRAQLGFDPGPHCLDNHGEVHIGALALLADLAMSASIRHRLHPAARLGTVSFQLHLTGAPSDGPLESSGVFQGFIEGAAGRQGISQVSVHSDGRMVAFGGASFMALDPPKNVTLHPVTMRRRGDQRATLPAPESLTADELAIVARSDRALDEARAEGGAFADYFWGRPIAIESTLESTAESTAESTVESTLESAIGSGEGVALLPNGLYASNRVGHMQGGLLAGFAVHTADQILVHRSGKPWRFAALSVAYVSPGEGAELRAVAHVIHHGGLTALVRTQIIRPDGRIAIEATTQHTARA